MPSRRTVHRLKDEFRSFFGQIVADRKETLKRGAEAEDVVSLMIQETLAADGVLSDEEVLNDMMTLFVAGHDTTTNTLTTVAYYLAKHPDMQERVRQEACSLVARSPA